MDSSVKKALKAKAHHLKPVILVGAKGLTQAVVDETDVALLAHELIKVKISGVEKEERTQMAKDICTQLGAELIQFIGHTATLYRKKPEEK